jgi:hypothetical protein
MLPNVQTYFDHIHTTGIGQMTEKPIWLTLNAAAELPECLVTGKTLREMIQRGDVPAGHWMTSPYGDSVIYLIDRAILPSLPYKKSGGQLGKKKTKLNR